MADAIEEVRNVEDPARNLGLCPACSEPLLEPATGNQIRFMKATWQTEPIRSRRGTEAQVMQPSSSPTLVPRAGAASRDSGSKAWWGLHSLYAVGEGKRTVADACEIPGRVHSDSINLERGAGRIIKLGVEREKIKSSFLDTVKFEVPEGPARGSRDVQ